MQKSTELQNGALIFGYRVKNHHAYGVVEFDENGNALGNEKLADQIGNTITFFTREYVVGGNTD